MSYEVIPTPAFSREAKALLKKYPSFGDDLAALVESLKETPVQGDAVFKNCYKIRLAVKSKGKGKSGGARIITFVRVVSERVYLLSAYDKSEQESISDKALKALIADLEED